MSLIKHKKSLSLMLTYQCTAECTDCGTGSSPRVKEQIPLEDAIRFINEARERDFGVVVFTGGEATLRWKDLLRGISHATSIGLPSRLVTNAHWATSLDVARGRIAALQRAGLKELNYSTGDEHARFIPIERVINASQVALEFGYRLSIMVESRQTRTVTRDTVMSLLAERGMADHPMLSIVESPWMPLDPHRVESYREGTSPDADHVHLRKGCDSVLSTYTVQGDGRIGACCGLGMRYLSELNVGDLGTTLQACIEKSEKDILKLLVRFIGPMRILDWAGRKNPQIQWEGMYGHHCQACIRIYRDPAVAEVLKAHYIELLPELKDALYLENRYVEAVTTQHVAAAQKIVHEM